MNGMWQDALTTLIAGAFKDLPSQQVFWGLLGAKVIDVALGITKAVLSKRIDPAQLKKAPLQFMLMTMIAGLLLCLHMVSSAFDPLIGLAVVAMGATEGASILRNMAAISVAMGTPVPPFLNTLTSYLEGVSNGGINAMMAPVDPALPALPIQDALLSPPAPSPASISDAG